jgi:hypothetical protein
MLARKFAPDTSFHACCIVHQRLCLDGLRELIAMTLTLGGLTLAQRKPRLRRIKTCDGKIAHRAPNLT